MLVYIGIFIIFPGTCRHETIQDSKVEESENTTLVTISTKSNEIIGDVNLGITGTARLFTVQDTRVRTSLCNC